MIDLRIGNRYKFEAAKVFALPPVCYIGGNLISYDEHIACLLIDDNEQLIRGQKRITFVPIKLLRET